MRRRGRGVHHPVQERGAADFLEDVRGAQLLGHGEQVNRRAAALHLAQDFKQHPVGGHIKRTGRELLLDGQIHDAAGIDQDGPQRAPLGFFAIRRNPFEP